MQNTNRTHPALSIRPFLTGFDSTISNGQLEFVYHVFTTSIVAYPPDTSFALVYQPIRAIYNDLARDLEMKLAHLQFKVEVQEAKLGQLQQALHGREADSVWQREQFVKMLQKKDEDLGQQREQFVHQQEQFVHQQEQFVHQQEQFERLLQKKDDDLVEQRDQYEARLAESRSDRADAIANEKQNTLVLQHHLLHIPRLITPTLKGSVSRAQTWRAAKVEHGFSIRKLPCNPGIVDAMRTLTIAGVSTIMAKNYRDENQIYSDFLSVIASALTDKASYHDTSATPFLGGQKPDLTLALPGGVEPDPAAVFVVIEVKKRNEGKLDTDKDLGQVFDYLVDMIEAQPGRRNFSAVLSSISRNIVVSLEVSETGWALVQHFQTDIYETLAYLHETALASMSHRPPSLGFMYDKTNMRRRLGNPRHCILGEFPVYGRPGVVMAIKRKVNPAVEIYHLRNFAAMGELRPPSIPFLHYVAPDESEFGIIPVGAPLVPGAFPNTYQATTVLTDIHSALAWLHKQGIVHRDVRCDNIVIDSSGHGVLIDFDAACEYRRSSTRIWRGGYISCPPSHVREVLRRPTGWSTFYAPGPADDWHAFILLVNCLVFPTTFVGFQSHLIGTTSSAESRRLLDLWTALEASRIWGPFVAAAKNCDVEFLKGLPDAFVWL